MTQHLWYIRKDGHVTGPFPAPQLRQAFSLGRLDLHAPVSLDGAQWMSLMDSGLLEEKTLQMPEEEGDDAWRIERERARLRWLNDSVEGVGEDDLQPDAVGDRLRRHEAETRTRLAAEQKRRPAFVAGLAFLLVLVVIGAGVWIGQSGESGIQASLTAKISNCALPAAEGVAWGTCNKQDANLAHAHLKNANLMKGNFARANLTGADLAYATLDGANLRGANLRAANLSGASLNGTDLTGADLGNANLAYAVLAGAKVDGARFEGAVLSKGTWIDGRICAEPSIGLCR